MEHKSGSCTVFTIDVNNIESYSDTDKYSKNIMSEAKPKEQSTNLASTPTNSVDNYKEPT